MGCNCGDNEYNIEIENNGDCEPTTPVYNITLGQIGVDGFSPKVNFINETSSSFQIQTIDVVGEEISGQVPLLSYVTNNYLLKDGSNAGSDITINNLPIKTYSGSGARLGNGGSLTHFAIQSRDVNIQNWNSSDTLLASIRLYNGNVNINTNNKAYYNNNEIATVDQLPTVNNPTITFTQGGVTKGSITLNQSTDQTIALDAGGGGGTVSNPIVFTESSTDGTRTTTGTLTLGLQTTGNIDPALKIHYDVVDSGQGGGGTFSWDEYLIDRTLPATNGGLTATTNSSSGRYIRNMSVNVDNSTIKINGSGQLYADITIPTYTAGDAIDITSNVIGVKIDGTSITLNADGELQSSGGVPSVIDGGNA